jgi:hypothetical protein
MDTPGDTDMAKKKPEVAEEEMDWRKRPRREAKFRNKHVSFRCTEDDVAALDVLSDEMMRPRADVLIIALREYVKMRGVLKAAKDYGFTTD